MLPNSSLVQVILTVILFLADLYVVSLTQRYSNLRPISVLLMLTCIFFFLSDLQVATTPSLVTNSTATTLTVNPVLPLPSAAVTNLSLTGKQKACQIMKMLLKLRIAFLKNLFLGVQGNCSVSMIMKTRVQIQSAHLKVKWAQQPIPNPSAGETERDSPEQAGSQASQMFQIQ